MKISRGHYCQRGSWDGPDYEHDMRLARRVKRRDIANQLNHKYCVNGTRTSSKKCCNSPEKETTDNDAVAEEDEVDYDYKYFLDNFLDHILDSCDDSADGSDFDDDKSCESDNDDDIDPHYKLFMDNLREDGNSYVLEVFADNKLVRVKYEEKQVDKRPSPSVPCSAKNTCCNIVDESYEEFLSSYRFDGDGFVYMPSGGNTEVYSSSDSEHVIMEPDQFEEDMPSESRKGLETKRGVSGKEGNSSIVGQKVQVSNEEIGALNKRPSPSVTCSAKNKCSNFVDESYKEFLSCYRFNGDGFVYMPNGGNTKVYEHEGGNSSDSELVIVEPDQFDEDTPFVPSSDYDISYCENKENLGGGHTRAMYPNYSSQFRKGLMQKLERPYDQKEYEGYRQEVSRRRQKERHMEGREGRTKSVTLKGLDKSYREVYPDLAQAIDQAKEPHKILFLLRGFFFWLEYKPHEGAFRPWLDKSCLEMLQKL